MATAAASSPHNVSLREDLTCAICCDLLQEPVMLPCMHHFCKSCIARYCSHFRPVTCPQCRKEFTSKQVQTNYLVTAMAEKVRASTSDSYIKNLEKKLKDHRLRREDFISSTRKYKEKMDVIKRVGAELQDRVQGEFHALQQLLQEEEACVLKQLRREQEDLLGQLQHHVEASREAVRELEHNMRVLEEAHHAASETSALAELPQLRPLAQVDPALELNMGVFSNKYMAPLQYITWRKMFKCLKPGPAPITFDVDTAHPNIYVSRDKTMALESDVTMPYKHSAKRFAQCVNVLAAQGFQTGRHYWEVDVGSKSKWDMGVASEQVDRHARIKLSPESGYWTLRLRGGDEYSAGTQPWTRLHLGSSPQRIGVFLDCEERRVSFYDAEDMSLLYSFADGPRGKAFPFFSPCLSDNSPQPRPIQLLHYHYPPFALAV